MASFVLKENKQALFQIVLLPVLMVACIRFRNANVIEVGEKVASRKLQVMHTAQNVYTDNRTIVDCHQRPHLNEIFAAQIRKLNESKPPMQREEPKNGFLKVEGF